MNDAQTNADAIFSARLANAKSADVEASAQSATTIVSGKLKKCASNTPHANDAARCASGREVKESLRKESLREAERMSFGATGAQVASEFVCPLRLARAAASLLLSERVLTTA
jgi:hypothetical protein